MTERVKGRIPETTTAAASLFPSRLIVYETPGAEELIDELARVYPAAALGHRVGWELSERSADKVVPVWHWPGTIEQFRDSSRDLLRGFAYPLLADDRSFVISFSFSRQELQPRSLDVAGLAWLDVEDIGRLLSADAVETRFDDISELTARVLQTPIEEILERALVEEGLSPRPQVKFDRYRLDFLVERNGRRVAIEADGREFHDSERDRRRDEALLARGLDRVFRFSGSAIFRDAARCAADVKEYIDASDRDRPAVSSNGRLDESQHAAVSHGGGAARVLAPAGAGKTSVLVHRIAALVESGKDPSTILALAFNRKAYEQLVKRLEDLRIPTSPTKLFDPTSVGVVCATFNAFGYRYQRELLNLDLQLEQSGSVWRDVMVRALRDAGITLRGARRGSDPLARFLEALERVRADLVRPDEEVVELEYIRPDGTEVVPFAPLLERFERRRLALGIQSFDDQLATAVVDLLGSPLRRQFVQARFSHVLVDEYQDLNGAQLALVEILSRPWRSLFVVGDDDQLIYGWRFAKLTNILDFHERMPREPYSRTYTLTTNYRSSRAIVEKARRLIDHNERRVPKDIRPAPGASLGEVRYARHSSWLARTHEVVNFLAEQRQLTRCWSDLAVLCRYKAQQPLIALALDRAEIPRSQLLAYRLFSDKNVRLLRSYIDLARKPRTLDGDTFRLLLNRPNRYLPNELVERYAQAPCPWDEVLCHSRQEEAPRGLTDLVNRVSGLRQKYRKRAPSSVELLDDVILSFGLEAHWKDEASPRPRTPDEGSPTVLVDLIRFHASEISGASDFLDFWDERVQREERHFGMEHDTLGREQSPDEDHVVIGTLHSSKGREYEAVVLFDYDLDLSELAAHEVEEERRVFYVGLTRARDSALITIDGRRDSLHPFIKETIFQGEPEEVQDIQARLRDLRSNEEALVIDRTKVQAAIEAVFSGEEIRGSEQHLRVLREQLSNEEQALVELESWLSEGGVRGLWRRASRKRQDVLANAASANAAVERTRATGHDLERRMLLVRGDPELAAASSREKANALDKELARIRKEARVLHGRMLELELVEVTESASDPGRAERRPV